MSKKPGRPVKHETPEEMQEIIDDYFNDYCYQTEIDPDTGRVETKLVHPPTVTGLAYHLDLTRQGLSEYRSKNKGFSDAIKRAKARIEMFNEEQLHRSQGKTSGVQFNLKENFGWKDKKQHEVNSNVNANVKQESSITHDLSELSVEELKSLESILSKTTENKPD